MAIEDVHPPEDVVTKFPHENKMALYHGNSEKPFIVGNYIDLERAR